VWTRLRSLLRVLAARSDFESGMTEEMRFHIEQYAADLVRSGVPEMEATRRARLEFGHLACLQEDCRDARGLNSIEGLLRQSRYAARMLRKSPAFTVTALLTLGICLGANLTIFAVIDSVLLRPLPFPNADQLLTVFNTYPKAGVDRDGSSLTNYYERRGQIPAFVSIALYRPGTATVGETGATERAEITRVTPDFFETLGLVPVIGRVFAEEETTYLTDDVAIVTDRYWRQRLNSDPEVTGLRIRVDGALKRVVGVLPRNFRFLSSEADIYLPLASNLDQRSPRDRHSGGNSTHFIARLRPGSSVAEAQAQIDAHNASLEANGPEGKAMEEAGFRSVVDSLHADHVASVRPALLVLQAGVLVLLLAGIVNLLNLLLIRANRRVKELAIRQALGASQRHVLAEVLVETAVLTLLGGLLGLVAAAGGTRLLSVFGVDRLPLGATIVMDGRIAFVALAGTLVITIVLAVPIAWLNLRGHLGKALQSETRGGTASRAVQRLRHGFLVAQITMAVILLTGAGLLSLSLKQALAVAPGFRPENILTGQMSMPGTSYATDRSRVAFAERVMNEIGRQPGVRVAGIATNLPFSGNSGKSSATAKGHVLKPGESPRGIYSYGVSGDYFQGMGFTLRAGRFLTAADSSRAERVCVVDEDFARYHWPESSALGKQLWQGFRRQPEEANTNELFTVVGVVGRVKQAGLTEQSTGAVYYPYAYQANNTIFVVARTVLAPESSALALQRVVRQLDPDIPVNDLRSMETRISGSLDARRTPALLAGLFSAIAVLLTAIGTYGVLSYAVSQRRREIGLRMALGATPEQIRSQFVRLALGLLVPGTVFGFIGAVLTGQAMRTVLFEVPALNGAILAAAVGIMGLVSLAASFLPSRRAARISPLEALSDD
jgi:predicted permease